MVFDLLSLGAIAGQELADRKEKADLAEKLFQRKLSQQKNKADIISSGKAVQVPGTVEVPDTEGLELSQLAQKPLPAAPLMNLSSGEAPKGPVEPLSLMSLKPEPLGMPAPTLKNKTMPGKAGTDYDFKLGDDYYKKSDSTAGAYKPNYLPISVLKDPMFAPAAEFLRSCPVQDIGGAKYFVVGDWTLKTPTVPSVNTPLTNFAEDKRQRILQYIRGQVRDTRPGAVKDEMGNPPYLSASDGYRVVTSPKFIAQLRSELAAEKVPQRNISTLIEMIGKLDAIDVLKNEAIMGGPEFNWDQIEDLK